MQAGTSQLQVSSTMARLLAPALLAQNRQVGRGNLLFSRSSKYLVQDFLGEGTFGRVAKCVQIDTNKTVAMKIMKSHRNVISNAKHEVSILKRLRALDPDKCNFVRWNSCFQHREYICLEFEMLGMSLNDFIKQKGFHGLHLNKIRPIIHQLATALTHFKSVGIIHTDLKPDNIMFVDHLRQPLKVKIIDFGAACQTSVARSGLYMQTRWYRAPEIMLRLPFTEAIDIWSLGCVAAELFLGSPLYPGRCEYEMFRYIVQTHGDLPDHLLCSGSRTINHFCRNTSGSSHLWRLKTPSEYFRDTGFRSADTLSQSFSSLNDLAQINLPKHEVSGDNVAEVLDRRHFVDMLKEMLQLDANHRITPSRLLQHPFISMSHLVDIFHYSPHVQSCYMVMAVCQRQRLDSDTGNTASWSSHQPSLHQRASSSTASLAQHRRPFQVHPAGRSSLTQPVHQGINTAKRKRSSPKTLVQGQSVVAPPIYTKRPKLHLTPPEPHRGTTKVETGKKRKRFEVDAGEKGSDKTRPENNSKRAKFTSSEDRHKDTARSDTKRARVSPKTGVSRR